MDIKEKMCPGELFRELSQLTVNFRGIKRQYQKNPHPKDLGDCDNPFDNGYFARPVVSREIINYIHGDGHPIEYQKAEDIQYKSYKQ